MSYDFEKAKSAWRELNRTENTVPLYMKDWYWDAVCKSDQDWRVICVWKNDKIEAAFPFMYTKRKGMWFIELPFQVAAAGIWLRDLDLKKKGKALSQLSHIVEEIVEWLPKYDCFNIIFNPMLWTWHPFYWKGFHATPFYTSIIKPEMLNDELINYINKYRRRRVRQGNGDYRVCVNTLSVDEYWEFFEESYKNRGRVISYNEKQFKRLIATCMEHSACEIRSVYDGKEMVAVNVLLKDEKRYYHQFGTHLSSENANATSLAVYDGIKNALEYGYTYDFEGSMIPGVCEFNMSWNPVLQTNLRITKYSNKYIFFDSCRRILSLIKIIKKTPQGGGVQRDRS